MYRAAGQGVIGKYRLCIADDSVKVYVGGLLVVCRQVAGIGRFVQEAHNLKLAYGSSDTFDVIYIYDTGRANWGYAINVQIEDYSEWGRVPIA